MGKTEIVWTPHAIRKLKKLERHVGKAIFGKVGELEDNLIGNRNVKKIVDSGQYRLRVGDYRAIFGIEDGKVVILNVGHRKSVYARG